MGRLKDFDESIIKAYSMEELKAFLNEAEMTKSIIIEKCSNEMSQKLNNDRFDAYSFFGRKALMKIAKKYDKALYGAKLYIDLLKTEIKFREDEEENMRYSGNSIVKKKQMTQEEFLKKEEDKTWVYRSKIE